jgi:Family of unknown function (DUF6488)
MIRPKTVLYIALLSFATAVSFAHEGHDEKLTDKRVAQLADKSLPKVVQSKKLNAQWATAQRQSVVQRKAAGKDVWMVTYKGAGADGQLYLFFDDLGNFVDANQTGKLAGE